MRFEPICIASDNKSNLNKVEETKFVTYSAASHQGAIKMFWLHFSGAVMYLNLIFNILFHWRKYQTSPTEEIPTVQVRSNLLLRPRCQTPAASRHPHNRPPNVSVHTSLIRPDHPWTRVWEIQYHLETGGGEGDLERRGRGGVKFFGTDDILDMFGFF